MKKNERKKVLASALALLLCLALLAGCAGTPETSPSNSGEPEASASTMEGIPESMKPFIEDLEPLETPVTLNTGSGTGVVHDFPQYLAEKVGLYDSVGIDLNISYYSSGPLVVEAMAAKSLDVAGTGIGGLIAGGVQDVFKITGIRADESVAQQFIVKTDSQIYKDGINEFGFYGTKESWQNAEIYVGPATNLQYALGQAMEKFGLKLDDLNIVYSDVSNCNTALYADKGDCWGLWNTYAYDSRLSDGYAVALSAADVGVSLPAGNYVRNDLLENPDYEQALQLWSDCQFAMVDWMQASDENMELAIDYFCEWNEEQGVTADRDTVSRMMKEFTLYTKEDNVALFTEKGEQGFYKATEMLLPAMDFYVYDLASYTEADMDKITDDLLDPSLIVE